MPDVVGGWIQKNLCDSSLDIKETAIASSFNYRDFTNLASSSLEFAAFRVSLLSYHCLESGHSLCVSRAIFMNIKVRR